MEQCLNKRDVMFLLSNLEQYRNVYWSNASHIIHSQIFRLQSRKCYDGRCYVFWRPCDFLQIIISQKSSWSATETFAKEVFQSKPM